MGRDRRVEPAGESHLLTHEVADYRALIEGLGIVGTVFVETTVDDADYQEEARLVAAPVGREGMLGQIASCRPETDEGFGA